MSAASLLRSISRICSLNATRRSWLSLTVNGLLTLLFVAAGYFLVRRMLAPDRNSTGAS